MMSLELIPLTRPVPVEMRPMVFLIGYRSKTGGVVRKKGVKMRGYVQFLPLAVSHASICASRIGIVIFPPHAKRRPRPRPASTRKNHPEFHPDPRRFSPLGTGKNHRPG